MEFNGCVTLTNQNGRKLYAITINRKVRLGNLPSIPSSIPAPIVSATFYRLADTTLPFHSLRSFFYTITGTDQIQLIRRIATLDALKPTIDFCMGFAGEDTRL
jgi:hypothetical protein